jgi:hypothetical protein
MCGGKLFPDAPNCCEPGYYCSEQFSDYFQCLPESMKPKTTTTTTTSAKPTSTTTTTTSPKPTTTTTTTTTTTSKKTTTTTTTTTTTKKAEPTPLKCAGPYDMCGGKLFPDAPNCCEPGYFCSEQFSDYFQCLPESMKPKTTTTTSVKPKTTTTTTTSKRTTTTTTTTKTAEPTPAKCGGAYDMCGGKLFPNAPNCCQSGYYCSKEYSDYYLCLPNSVKPKTTTTTKKTTTTTTTSTPKPTTCAKAYNMCNGNGKLTEYPSCCQAGHYCNSYWNLCLPEESTPTPTTTKKTTTTTTKKSSTTKKTTTTTTKATVKPTGEVEDDKEKCAKAYYPCGGERFPEITHFCCEEGSTCIKQNEFYYQCVPNELI